MIKEDFLRKKGWSESEIKKATAILSKKRKTFFSEKVSSYIYWFALLITIAGNFVVVVAMIPFFLYLSNLSLFFTVLLVAATFSMLLGILLKDIALTDPNHHIIVKLFMPAVMFITIYMIIDLLNTFADSAGSIAKTQSPVLISIAYVLGFLAPFVFGKISDLSAKISA